MKKNISPVKNWQEEDKRQGIRAMEERLAARMTRPKRKGIKKK